MRKWCMTKPGISLVASVALTLGLSTIIPVQAAQEFNVKEFGAKGDGKSDDTEAIQRAIEAAQQVAPNGIVVIPKGTYLYSSELILKTTVILEGRDEPVLEGITERAEVDIQGPATVRNIDFSTRAGRSGAVRVNTNAKNWVISGNKFVPGPFVWDIAVVSATDGVIKDNIFTITTSTDAAIEIIYRSNNIKVDHNTFVAQSSSSGVELSESNQIAINNNNFRGLATGVFLETATDGVSITNNVITQTDIGIDANKSANLTISGNTITDQTAKGIIAIEGHTLLVEGNTISRTNANPIEIDLLTGSVRITSNTISDGLLKAVQKEVAAMIFVDCPGADIGITGNSYSGNTEHARYFIWCLQDKAKVSGNTTNTGLPNRVGP
jgi:parallel beta-helix repeat protein